jgi:hypothetical protein
MGCQSIKQRYQQILENSEVKKTVNIFGETNITKAVQSQR